MKGGDYAEYSGDSWRIYRKDHIAGIGVIDIIEIGLISFFVYQFMAWIKFTRLYTPERYSGSPCIYPCSLYI